MEERSLPDALGVVSGRHHCITAVVFFLKLGSRVKVGILL